MSTAIEFGQISAYCRRWRGWSHHHHLFGRKQKIRNSSCNRHTGNTRL